MGTKLKLTGAALALALFAQAANAQNTVELPQIVVTSSRLGGEITGSSTSVITADQIARSPAQSLPDILGQAAGVQVTHLYGNPTGINDMVDLRGFGAFAQPNVLVLVNGRRFQDLDSQGFDFSTIPLDSIERIEITRGNSGTVLYGDGAIGGVINIVTKTAAAAPFSGKVEGAVGSYGYQEGRISAASSFGPWSTSLYANTVGWSGYRQNSKSNQQNVIGNINYKTLGWSSFLTISGDRQSQDLPGALPNLPSNAPFANPIGLNNPRGSNTPLDWATKQDFNITAGFTHTLGSGADLIVDGGVRRKFQQSNFLNYFNNASSVWDPLTAGPMSYVNTVMTTSSLTPRLDMSHQAFGVPNHLLTGLDVYNTQYGSDRSVSPGDIPIHHYDVRQTTVAIYGMNTATVLPSFDISFGGRLQRNIVNAADAYNASMDPNANFYATNPQAPPVDMSEWQWAAHLGYEYRATSVLTFFGRVARAFRLPNADERVGSGSAFSLVNPPNLDLKTQTSYDVEDGFRVKWGRFNFESSAYLMELTNEIHFIPALFLDVNLDPTQRLGWENSASYQLTDDVRLHGGFAYTRATFREGPFAGNDIPLVSRWSGNAGASWDIWKKMAVLDVTGRFVGERRMDNDQTNTQPLIPANVTVDVKLAGQYDRFFWSAAVLNLFDVSYFDYAIASAFTQGFYNAYPQPGRTFMLRGGMTF
ncbi:MAG TPA: TonB-dependent receptor [Pseudolabrys sp.]|nr:TonB-dependent receptor [Pseudolabrys sp.]